MSVLFILLILVGLLINPVTIVINDFWYHLSITKQFIAERSIIFWDQASFQPLGRPNLYPPLLHILLSFLLYGAKDLVASAHLLGTLFNTLFLLVFWWFNRVWWNEKIALMGLLAVTLSSVLSLTFFSLMPASMSLIILFPLLIFFYRKKTSPTILLLILLFYLYTPFYILLMLSFGIFVYKFKEYKALYLKSIMISLIFGVPWMVYYIIKRPDLNIAALGEADVLSTIGLFSHYSINIVFYLIAIIGIWRLAKFKDKKIKLLYCILIGFVPYLFLYGGRYFWHLYPVFVIFAVYQFEAHIIKFFKNFNLNKAFLSVILSLILIVPLPTININSFADNRIISPDWTLADFIFMDTQDFYETEEYIGMVDFIKANTDKNTILIMDDPELAQSLYVTADRVSDNGLYWESVSEETIRSLGEMRESDETAVFVYHFSELPSDIAVIKEFGEYTVGFRRMD